MGRPASTEVPVLRSEGQRMLLAVTGTLAAIAAEVGCRSVQTVADWKSGTKSPNPATRARIYTAFGIPARAWSIRPGGALDEPEPEQVSSPVPGIAAPSTLDDCLALLAVIRRDRSQTGLMPSERVKLAAAEARILQLRAQLEQAAEFAESRYVSSHPSWLRLRRALVEALEPHPLAMQAVLNAIAQLDSKRQQP